MKNHLQDIFTHKNNYMDEIKQIVASVFGSDTAVTFYYALLTAKPVPEFRITVLHAEYEGTNNEAGYPFITLKLAKMKITNDPQCDQCLDYVRLCLELYRKLQDMMNRWLMDTVIEDTN